jgi:predicted nucleic acid-binding protein
VNEVVVFLDANPVIYMIEQPPNLGPKARARVAALLTTGERLAVSDLVRMQCQVGPLKANDAGLVANYLAFFHSPDVSVLPVSPGVCDRAARIRAQYGFKPLDSLHLAVAVEYGCTRFLTSDSPLKRFPDVFGDSLVIVGPDGGIGSIGSVGGSSYINEVPASELAVWEPLWRQLNERLQPLSCTNSVREE